MFSNNNENNSFRSIEQLQAVTAALLHNGDVLIVMPTGGGKTLTYLIPAMLEDEMTVVVVPFEALIRDLKSRCEEAGVKTHIWDGSFPRDTRLLLVSANSKNWDFLESGHIRRIVVEEVHEFLSAGFRSELRQVLQRLSSHKV